MVSEPDDLFVLSAPIDDLPFTGSLYKERAGLCNEVSQ